MMTIDEAIKELKDASDEEVRYGDTDHHYDEVMKRVEAFNMAIKALEFDLDKHDEEVIKNTVETIWGEPCEDAISREAVNVLIDELARTISDERCFIPRNNRPTSTIMQDILDLPSVTQKTRWIPCSERLPEKGGYYMVTLDHGIWGLSTIQDYFNELHQRWDHARVIAWCERPQPYNAESEARG